MIEQLRMLDSDLDVATRTVWGEARGEQHEGRVAVACVMVNRALKRHRGEARLAGVCIEPWQFSCWNSDDPNLPKLLTIGPHEPLYRHCLRALLEAFDLVEEGRDPTSGATHYHTHAVAPKWADGKMPCALVGRHRFYNNID